LAEARSLCFAALWPQTGNGDGPSVRLNLVWNGRLREPVSLYPGTVEAGIGTALTPLWEQRPSSAGAAPPLVAVPKEELDSFLAVRRWFHEADQTFKLPIPEVNADAGRRQAFVSQLVAEAYRILQVEPLT
jgi:hypothetical protein